MLPSLKNFTSYCPCLPGCSRTEYDITVSQAVMSSYYARKFILSDLRVNEELKAVLNIADFGILLTRNRSYIESLAVIGQTMEKSQAQLILARENGKKMLNLLSDDVINITHLFTRKMELVQELNKYLNTFERYNSWLYGHFLFDFMAQEHPAEDFNIRVAYDLLRDGKYMKNFTDQFTLYMRLFDLNLIDSYVKNLTSEVILYSIKNNFTDESKLFLSLLDLNNMDSLLTSKGMVYNNSYQIWNETLTELNNQIRNEFDLASSLIDDIQQKFDRLVLEVQNDERLQDLLGYYEKFDVHFAR